MDFSLSDEQRLIVDTVRAFVENEIYPHEAEIERTGTVPHELGMEIAAKCRDIGFFAANIPEEFGGGPANTLICSTACIIPPLSSDTLTKK